MNHGAATVRSRETNSPARLPLLDHVAFVVLAAVLCARPLISESFAHFSLSFIPADAPGGTTPATTVWLDGILLLAAALVWVRRWQSGDPRSRGGIESPSPAAKGSRGQTHLRQDSSPLRGVVGAGLGLLLAAVVVSVAAAHDKRLAANAGAHLFVMALAGTALVTVMRTRWMAYALIAALVAGGVSNAAKCITQRAYELDATLEYWEEQEPARIAAGIDPDSPAIVNYERRLRSGQAFGHLHHPNVTAACLAMSLLVVAGLLVGVLRRPGLDASRRAAAMFVALALGLALAVGLWLTGSTGAAVAATLSGVVLLAAGVGRGWIVRHVRGAFVLIVIGYAGMIAAGTGYGLTKGTLPHTSLAFRWDYWRATARVVRDAPLTGIGRENFRAAYLRYKLPESTEEVSNPHNVWLSLLAELGPLGLIAGVLLTGAAGHTVLRRLGETGASPPAAARAGAIAAGSMTLPAGFGADPVASAPCGGRRVAKDFHILRPPQGADATFPGLHSTRQNCRAPVAAVALGVLLVQAVFSGEQFGIPGIPLLWATEVAGIWALAFLATYLLVSQADGHPSAIAWLVVGLGAALLTTLVHNLLGFSLLTPAGLAMFVGLAASAAALRTEPARLAGSAPTTAGRGSRVRGAIPAVLCVLLATVYFYKIARPTIRSEAALRRARLAVHGPPDVAAVGQAFWHGLEALRTDPWDAEPPRILAQGALQMAASSELPDDVRQAWLETAKHYLSAASHRNRSSFETWRMRAELSTALAESSGNNRSWAAAVREWEIAIALYPTDPRTRISAGKVWFGLWKQTESPREARRSVRHFQAALAIDATRLPEVAAKLRPVERAVIHRHLDELETAGFESARPAGMIRP